MLMPIRFLLLLSVFSLPSLPSRAQKLDNTVSVRSINNDRYFRIHYDNDYFTATDKYYTQGYNFELVLPALRKNPLVKFLIHFRNSEMKYGLSFEHIGFTPTSIASDTILYKDRPFACNLMIKSFSISTDTLRRMRLASVLSLGMIGPIAFGKGMQTTIHRWVGDETPHGWDNQISNDIVLNYELNHEKELISFRHLFSLASAASLRAGTLNDKLQLGFISTLGKHYSSFSTVNGRKNLQLYLYGQPLVNFIAYDATLQGGLFNKSSPYTIAPSEINRMTLQGNFGAVFTFRKIYLEYSQSILSKEFATGTMHRWGGIRIGFFI